MTLGLHCLTEKGCPGEVAREALASDRTISDVERSSLAEEAKVCVGPQPDPFDVSLTWSGCPGREAFKHRDVADTLTVKAIASMVPLAGWPERYAARILETWSDIEAERVRG